MKEIRYLQLQKLDQSRNAYEMKEDFDQSYIKNQMDLRTCTTTGLKEEISITRKAISQIGKNTINDFNPNQEKLKIQLEEKMSVLKDVLTTWEQSSVEKPLPKVPYKELGYPAH